MKTAEGGFAGTCSIPTSGVNLDGCKMVIEGGSSIRVYDGGTRLVLPKTYVIGTDTLPSTLQVEGYTTGSSTLDAVFKSASNVEFYRDRVKLSVIKADVDVDSNNDGSINDTDDPIEYFGSGQYIPFNDDDDNGNGIADYLESTAVQMENDLREVKLSNVGVYGPPPPMPGPLLTSGYKLVLEGSSNIKVWTTPQKTAQVVLPKTYTTGTDTIPASVYVEGTGTGPAELVYTYKTPNNTTVHSDKVVLTVESMLREVDFIEPSSATGGIIPVTVQVKTRYCNLTQLKLFERENNTNPTHITDWADLGSYTLVSSSTSNRITTAVYRWNWNSVGNVMMGNVGLHNGNHDLKAKATFAGNIIKEEITGKSTNNLVISSCTPASVVCWKGDEGTTVPVQVNLTDNDLNDPA